MRCVNIILKTYLLQTYRFLRFQTTAFSAMAYVEVEQGRLKGQLDKLNNGTVYCNFKGIPYAKPPIGNLRFKAPLPPEPWQGTYSATEHGAMCPQIDMTTGQIIEGNENCLYLNIYTKQSNLSSKKLAPVMFWIHGGAFMSGSGNTELYGPEYLLSHNVIVVTINYRLEALGFLCLDNEDVPGNAGMKDQVAALTWVKKNIKKFGGDPDNITIFGESAGGASVTYHLVSPLSRGLFNKAIAQSGVFLNDWTYSECALERAFRLGRVLGCPTDKPEELLQYLQSVPASQLVKVTSRTMSPEEKHRGLPIHFTPVVEKPFTNVDSFLNENSFNLLLNNKIQSVPLILGYNTAEGIMILRDSVKKIPYINKAISCKVPHEVFAAVTKTKSDEYGQRIKDFYFKGNEVSDKNLVQLADLESDINFVYNIHRFAHIYSSVTKMPIYKYRFECDTEINLMKIFSGFSDMLGACHADELFYLFNNQMTQSTVQENQKIKEIILCVTKLWTNFAKTGNPTPDDSLGIKWKPYVPSGRAYLSINEIVGLKQDADKERVDFWNKIYCDAGLPCITKSKM